LRVNNLNFKQRKQRFLIKNRLQVVSTKVGGIPEILPDSMLILSEPNISDLLIKLEEAINRHKSGNSIDPINMHNQIKEMYDWRDIARRTEIVYEHVMESTKNQNGGIIETVLRFRRCGYAGFYFMAFIIIVDYLLILLLEFLNPAKKIDKAYDASKFKSK